MRKVILQEFLTIDGFAAGPNGELDFFDSFAGDKELDEDLLRFIDTVDTILLGGATYRMFVEFWPTPASENELVADKLNATPKLVFSRTLDRAPWGKWEEATVISSSAAEEITRLKRQPGKNMVLWGSMRLAQSLMKEGVIDEYQLRVCPILLGNGRRLFPEHMSTPEMKTLETKTYGSGLVLLRYQPGGGRARTS